MVIPSEICIYDAIVNTDTNYGVKLPLRPWKRKSVLNLFFINMKHLSVKLQKEASEFYTDILKKIFG